MFVYNEYSHALHTCICVQFCIYMFMYGHVFISVCSCGEYLCIKYTCVIMYIYVCVYVVHIYVHEYMCVYAHTWRCLSLCLCACI